MLGCMTPLHVLYCGLCGGEARLQRDVTTPTGRLDAYVCEEDATHVRVGAWADVPLSQADVPVGL
jgi:hypothetical protein